MRRLVWILVMAACGGSAGSTNDLFGSSGGGAGGGDGGATDGAVAHPNGDTKIACGANLTCTVGSQLCCAVNLASGTPSFSCKPSSSRCEGTPITCDDGADCPGQMCCGQFSADNGYRSISCMPSCSGTMNGDKLVRFCNPSAQPDECAAQGGVCRASAGFVGYYRCEP
jgi:hypothetical protein